VEKKIDPFKKSNLAVIDKDARKQLGWLYLWTILLLALTIASGLSS
jgi:hypothetical protein